LAKEKRLQATQGDEINLAARQFGKRPPCSRPRSVTGPACDGLPSVPIVPPSWWRISSTRSATGPY